MDYHNKKILVTGAAGLIGREVVSQLSKFDCEIVGVDNNSRYKDYQPKNCKFVQSDLNEYLIDKNNDFDFIFHMAAINGTSNFYQNPSLTLMNNTLLDINVFKFAEKGKSKLIYSSSSEVVSDSNQLPTSEIVDININNIHNPRWSYRLPKILSENYLANSNIDYLIIRFFNVYSEHSGSGHFVKDIVQKIKNKDFSLIGGNETRSFCYVADAVDAVLETSSFVSKEIVNVGHNEELLILDAANIIASALGVNDIQWNMHKGLDGSVKRRCPSIDKLISFYPTYSPNSFKNSIEKIKHLF